VYLIAITGLLFFTPDYSQAGNDSLFAKANACYAAHRYLEAEMLYQRLLSGGIRSAGLHFNIGNTYYHMRKFGPAVYHYRIALRLKPGDDDIVYNLTQAELNLEKPVRVPPELSFLKSLKNRFLSIPTEWFSHAVLMLWLISGVLTILFWKKRLKLSGFYRAMLLIVSLFILMNALWALRSTLDKFGKEGIILPRELTARPSPGESGKPAFTLYEGWQVDILDADGGWLQIRLPDGQEGWVPFTSVGIL